MMGLREASGIINEHLSVTKDKYGEIYLQLKMLDYFLQNHKEKYNKFTSTNTKKLNIYIVSRLFKVLGQLLSFHDDERYDFKELLENIGINLTSIDTLMRTAIFNGFDVNWIINYEIPSDVIEIQKDLREKGYLK